MQPVSLSHSRLQQSSTHRALAQVASHTTGVPRTAPQPHRASHTEQVLPDSKQDHTFTTKYQPPKRAQATSPRTVTGSKSGFTPGHLWCTPGLKAAQTATAQQAPHRGQENALCKQTAADGSAVVESLGTDNRAPLQMQDCHTPQQTQLKVKQSFIFVFGRE